MDYKDQTKNLLKLINSSEKILLINHVRMDPDAYWSLIGLYYVLEKLWKDIRATNDYSTPEDFSFLWWENIIEKDLDIKEFNPDLIISLDAWSVGQLWLTYVRNKDFIHSKDFVVIDHHITNDWFWSLNIIDKKASSTCELIYNIIKDIKLDHLLDEKIATLLITWIITDTNIYYNANTSPKTLKVASELAELWANSRLPIFHFYRKKEFNKTKLWWEILKDIKKSDDSKIVWCDIKEEYFEKTNTSTSDLTGLINEFLANIEDSEVCFMLYSLDNWKIKASLRSKRLDIAQVCSIFWWWWHKLAAWFTSRDDLDTVKEKLLKELKKICN